MVDSCGTVGGEYYVDPAGKGGFPISKIREYLADAQSEEPGAGWHLETRGECSAWHRWTD
jgi:hypothetical protein